jgi:hypothetical protein
MLRFKEDINKQGEIGDNTYKSRIFIDTKVKNNCLKEIIV